MWPRLDQQQLLGTEQLGQSLGKFEGLFQIKGHKETKLVSCESKVLRRGKQKKKEPKRRAFGVLSFSGVSVQRSER